MRSFNDLLTHHPHHRALPSATVTLEAPNGTSLSLQIDRSERITAAAYQGPSGPWLEALCELVTDVPASTAQLLLPEDFLKRFQSEPVFCDLWTETEGGLWFLPVELLRAALDSFRGREALYEASSPLVCRCFAVREDQILSGVKTRAGMGCRSCRPELQRLLNLKNPKRRLFKGLSHADWLLLADEKLQSFHAAADWRMEIAGFRGNGIVVRFKKQVSQREEEEMVRELQGFLAPALDSDLGVFLSRA